MDSKKTKFCTNCGKKIPISVKFCPYCGHQQINPNTQYQVNYHFNQLKQKSDEYRRNQQQKQHERQIEHKNLYNGQPTYSKQNAYNSNSVVNNVNRHKFTSAEQRYINVFVRNHEKHMLPAYLLLLVFVCGTHFYLHQNAAGIILILINIVFEWFFIGIFIDIIWAIIDCFLIPVWVHDRKARAKRQAISFVMMQRQNA